MRDQVIDLIAAYTDVEPASIRPESRLQEDLGLDSIDAIEILATLEEMLDRRFEQEQLTELVTVSDVLDRLDDVTR